MTSILLARFWGMYIVIFGAMLLARPSLKEQLFAFAKRKEAVMGFGFIAFTMGLVNIVLHNVWAWDYRLIITLFGWIALFRGISRMAYPELSINTIPKINNGIYSLLMMILIGLGAYLLWIGWLY